jgi:aminoglycoside 3-N-acetyltransferase
MRYTIVAVAAAVTRDDVRRGIRELGLGEQTVIAHSSLRSFGRVDGGAEAVVGAFADEGSTLVVPAFAATVFGVAPPEGMRPDRNAYDYDAPHDSPGRGRIFRTDSNEISPSMGTIAAAALATPERLRGSNPLCSFAAVGPRAELVREQRPLDVYAPLRILAARDGFVLLIGVGLERMTLIHLAEERAGRTLFRRWANAADGKPMEVEVGGCSDGFGKLEPVLGPLARETTVGKSHWRAFPARVALERASDAIRDDPSITRCDSPSCLRCRDAAAGGPVDRGHSS